MVIINRVTPSDESHFSQLKIFIDSKELLATHSDATIHILSQSVPQHEEMMCGNPQNQELHFSVEATASVRELVTSSIWLTLISCLASQGYLQAHITPVLLQSFRDVSSR